MTDQIKNRVVGAIVVFALAIIFIPKIYDGEKESQRREFVTIPKKPAHQTPKNYTTPKADEVSVVKLNHEKDKVIATEIVENKTIEENTKKLIVKEDKVTTIKAEAWVIRMGSFSNPDNVNGFVKKLRNKGFTAFSVPAVPKLGISNKVFVGPELNHGVLVKLQPKLKNEFKESGVIVKYNPLL